MNCGTQDVVVDPKSRRTKIYKKGVRHEDVSEDESNKKEMERKSALIWERSRMQSAQLMKKLIIFTN